MEMIQLNFDEVQIYSLPFSLLNKSCDKRLFSGQVDSGSHTNCMSDVGGLLCLCKYTTLVVSS